MINSELPSVTALGNDSAVVFSFDPVILPSASSDLTVFLVAADGTVTELVEGTGTNKYLVTVLTYPGTGYITYPTSGTGKLATGDSLIMKRIIPLTQDTRLGYESGYSSVVQEALFDRTAMRAIQMQEEIDRAVKAPIGSTPEDYQADLDLLVTEASGFATAASGSATAAAASASTASAAAIAAAASADTATTAAASLTGTSATSTLIGTGAKVFTTQAGKQFNVGAFVVIASAANVANYMFGQVTAYSGTSLSVTVATTGGSGTYSDWLINIAGARGSTGPTGPGGAGSGDVSGPASAANGNLVAFDMGTGKLIKDSGVAAGTMAGQNANNVNITGGAISGITDLPVADGGTGASTASAARTNLGLAIGSAVQAFSAILAALAGVTGAADKLAYFTGASAMSVTSFTSYARTLLALSSKAAVQTELGIGAASVLRGFISPDFTLTWVSNTEIGYSAGQLADDTFAQYLVSTGGTVNCAGTGADGLDTGTLQADKWYSFYIITNGVNVKGVMSKEGTVLTLPGGYTIKRRAGWVKTDASSHFLPFIQTGRRFRLTTLTTDITAQALTLPRANLTLLLPTGKKWPVLVSTVLRTDVNGICSLYIGDPDSTDQTTSITAAPLTSNYNDVGSSGKKSISTVFVVTNTSAQIAVKIDQSNATIWLHKVYWEDDGL